MEKQVLDVLREIQGQFGIRSDAKAVVVVGRDTR